MRRMLPLKMAEAETIHTSQGTTEPNVVVSKPETLNIKLLYVACSRVTSLNGLYFTNHKNSFNVTKLRPKHIEGKEEIEYLESKRPVHFYLHYLQDYLEYDTFIFANIQSLPKYFEFITVDKCFISAKYIFFVETWTLNNDKVDINNYRCIYRHDCIDKQKHPYGTLLYMRETCDSDIEIIYENNIYKPDKNNYVSHNIVAFTVEEYCFCIVYRSASESIKIFQDIFVDMMNQIKKKLQLCTKIVIVGDFNVNINENQGNNFLHLCI